MSSEESKCESGSESEFDGELVIEMNKQSKQSKSKAIKKNKKEI